MQDLEEAESRYSGKAVSVNGIFLAAMNDIDIIPGFKIPSDRGVRRFIGSAQIGQRFVGENYSPAKRVVGAVTFIDRDLVCSIGCLHEDGKVHPGGAATDDSDSHACRSSSALPSLSTPSLKSSGWAHMPMRKCCGDSKKQPGTIAVSYFSRSKV